MNTTHKIDARDTAKVRNSVSARKKRRFILLCVGLVLCITAYLYHTILIKIRPFPEDGRLSPSGCYVTKMYYIDQLDDFIIDYNYSGMAAFLKVFDAKTKKCVYTSNIYHLDALSPLIEFDNRIRYGFLSINTECKKKFVPPEEFEENE